MSAIQSLNEQRKWELLVLQRFRDGVLHLLQKLGERGASGYVRAKDHWIGKVAYGMGKFGRLARHHRHPHSQVLLTGVAMAAAHKTPPAETQTSWCFRPLPTHAPSS